MWVQVKGFLQLVFIISSIALLVLGLIILIWSGA